MCPAAGPSCSRAPRSRSRVMPPMSDAVVVAARQQRLPRRASRAPSCGSGCSLRPSRRQALRGRRADTDRRTRSTRRTRRRRSGRSSTLGAPFGGRSGSIGGNCRVRILRVVPWSRLPMAMLADRGSRKDRSLHRVPELLMSSPRSLCGPAYLQEPWHLNKEG